MGRILAAKSPRRKSSTGENQAVHVGVQIPPQRHRIGWVYRILQWRARGGNTASGGFGWGRPPKSVRGSAGGAMLIPMWQPFGGVPE